MTPTSYLLLTAKARRKRRHSRRVAVGEKLGRALKQIIDAPGSVTDR